jgi:hypothetical protein
VLGAPFAWALACGDCAAQLKANDQLEVIGVAVLRRLKDLSDYTMSSLDGDWGDVSDFYFDDVRWTVRYLVVDTSGFWEPASQVLVSPIAFRDIDWDSHRIQLQLTQDKVQRSPELDLTRPIPRAYEQQYLRYYDWPPYWGQSKVWGSSEYPESLAVDHWRDRADDDHTESHLRSVREATGFHIEGLDGEIGRVKDFVIDDRTWTIRYIVADVGAWWRGQSVLLAPHWIESIRSNEGIVCMNMPRRIIRASPEWSLGDPIGKEYELRLRQHYEPDARRGLGRSVQRRRAEHGRPEIHRV